MIWPELLFLLLSEKDKFKRALLAGWQCGVYSKARPCRISAIWKKMPHKIYVAVSNGAQKNTPKDQYYFFKNKVFENITDNNTDLMASL